MNIFHRSYYKVRIILTFCTVTALMVILMTWFGYIFVRDMYLDQISEKVMAESGLVASQISGMYLNLLEAGPPTSAAQNYFENIFAGFRKVDSKSSIFIFDKSFVITVHSDPSFPAGVADPRLLLNEKEIFGLTTGTSTVSLPVKGEDGLWYLWGFFRLNENYWLGIKESATNFDKVDSLALKFFYIGFAGIIFTIILSLVIAKSISKPVEKLGVYSSSIGKGKFDVELPTGMKGEFMELARAMEKMKNDLSRSYRELAENQKEREKMLAQIAHEIRNPLGGIELLAGLTKEDLQNSKMNLSYIDKIIIEINRLKKLITEFLEFGKPVPANRELCNLDTVSDEILGSFARQMEAKEIAYIKDIRQKFVMFDKEHLKQILFNIVSNSIEMVNHCGNIIVESKKDKENWHIIISDNGRGIPDENMSAVFEPFFTTKKNGTGLGLAVCKKLCSENKASITAENRKEGGAKFIISGTIENA